MSINLNGDKYYDTWIAVVRDALSCLDQERYNWLHLPSSGGYYDQDEFLLSVWEYVRYEFIQAKRDETFMNNLKRIYSKA